MTENEKNLLAGCIRGDKASWDAFVRQYSNLVYHTIRKTLALRHTETSLYTVDDLFQEIFLSLIQDAFLQLRRFRGDHGCTLASWLRMIATRRTIDHLRKSNEPPDSANNLGSSDPASDSDDSAIDAQIQFLASVITQLEPRERILLDLLFRENISAQDVASILHLSVGAVYTQKSRILTKLRTAFEKAG
jgi:RNA polymerase sigma factor (sigma-70 family)